MPTKAVARWQRDKGVIPGRAGEIAAFIAANNGDDRPADTFAGP